jgi:hypothetical protein
MKPTIRWIVWAIIIAAAIIYALVTESWGLLFQLGAVLIGVYVGDFLMRGAYRLLDLGQSAVRSIAWGVGVGGAIIWLTLGIVLEPQGTQGNQEPNLVASALAGIFGVIVGAVTRAIAISKQLRTEDRRP